MGKEIKDVIGTIKRITPSKSRDFEGKKGPFTIWSIGILMDDGNWYNLKDKEQQKVDNQLHSDKLEKKWRVGDEVKMFLEAEDAAGKYWKISTMIPFNPTDEVPHETIEDTKETDKEAGEKIPPPAPTPKEEPKEEPKDQPKDMKSVNDYKIKEADIYELGMAKNNAAVIFAGMIQRDAVGTGVALKQYIKDNADYYDKVVVSLFNRGKKIRQQIFGY